MSNIFAETAPALWAAGLPAIPLAVGRKNPVFEGWSRYSAELPDAETQRLWLEGCAPGNIGLPLGPAGKILVIDVDNDDPEIMKLVEKLAGKSPWKRVGKKGAALAYKWTDEQTKRIHSEDKNLGTLVEVLATGTQIVLPPSIHPDTKKPYVADSDLAEVVSKGLLRPLPPDFVNALRAGLEQLGYKLKRPGIAKVSAFVPAGERNVRMTSFAGVMARGVQRGERTLLEAINEMGEWVRSLVEVVAGDDSVTEGKAQSKLVEFLVRDLGASSAASLPPGWDDGMTDEMKKQWGIEVSEAQVRLDYQQIVDLMNAKAGTVAEMVWLDEVVTRIAQNKNLTDLEVNSLLGDAADLARSKGVTRSVLMKQINSMRSGDIRGESHGEIAEHLIGKMVDDGEVLHAKGELHQWTGSYWGILDPENVRREIIENYKDLPAARRNSDFDGILKTCRTLTNGSLADEPGFNFANGWVNTKGELIEHNERWGANYCVDYRYMPETSQDCPQFFELLHNYWSHQPDYAEKLLALQEIYGVTMFRAAPSFNKVFCLYGFGSTGKTTLLKILQGLIPTEMSCNIPPQSWGETFVPAHLSGKLLNWCGELPENAMIDGANFKQIVEGASMLVQKKNVDAYNIAPDCAHWFASNHLPKTRDYSSGFNRRWLFLDFDRRFGEHEKIIDIDKKIIAEEREAIAAWAVQGYLRAVRNGRITEPGGHKMILNKMIGQNNNCLRWFRDSGEVIVKTGDSVSVDDAYHNYRFTCMQGSMKPCSPFEFERRLEEVLLDSPVYILNGTMHNASLLGKR